MALKRITMSSQAGRISNDAFFNLRSWALWLLAVVVISLGGYEVGHAYGHKVIATHQPVFDVTPSDVVSTPAMDNVALAQVD